MTLVAQSCPTLCDPMDCSPPVSSAHVIFQARTLEWVAISFSRELSQPRDQTWVSCIAGRFLTIWVTREATQALLESNSAGERGRAAGENDAWSQWTQHRPSSCCSEGHMLPWAQTPPGSSLCLGQPRKARQGLSWVLSTHIQTLATDSRQKLRVILRAFFFFLFWLLFP